MKHEPEDLGLLGCAAMFVFFIAVVLGGWALAAYRCHVQYPSMQPQWFFFAGCTIQTDKGRIPAGNWRVL